MYRVEVFASLAEAEEVLDKSRELGISFYAEEARIDGRTVMHLTAMVPESMVDKVIEELTGIVDLRRGENAVLASKVEAGTSAKYRFLARRRDMEGLPRPLEGLLEEAQRLSTARRTSLVQGSVASLVALAGLIMENPVILVGAMLISPILDPIYGFAVSVTLGKARTALRALSSLALLLGAMIGVAVAASVAARLLVSQNTPRFSMVAEPGAAYLAIALLLGGAGMVARVEREHEALAGVAIAAALVPPAAAAGLGIGFLQHAAASKALLLVAENIVGIMAGALAALQLLGVEPRRYYDKRAAKRYLARITAVLLALILLLALMLR